VQLLGSQDSSDVRGSAGSSNTSTDDHRRVDVHVKIHHSAHVWSSSYHSSRSTSSFSTSLVPYCWNTSSTVRASPSGSSSGRVCS